MINKENKSYIMNLFYLEKSSSEKDRIYQHLIIYILWMIMQGESVLQQFGNFQTLPQRCPLHFYFFNFLSTFFLRLVRNSISLAARSSASFCFAFKKNKIIIFLAKKGVNILEKFYLLEFKKKNLKTALYCIVICTQH